MVLMELLGTLGGLVKIKAQADIDSAMFKLHYKITATILLSLSLVVTTNSLVGDPINCTYEKVNKIPTKVLNTYCWIHSTFTLPKYTNGPEPIYPGIGLHKKGDDVTYHAYYQWVPFFLFFQGILFYVPHWIWKTWENKKVEYIIIGLTSPVMDRTERFEKIRNLADYLHLSLHQHNFYAIRFAFCELLNLINVLINMWAMNKFLGGMFFSLGYELVQYVNMNQENKEAKTDPLLVVFPRVTKCQFRVVGPSGTNENIEALCVLALNAINEKIYVFLWFWFVILATLSSFYFLYRIVVFTTPYVRSGLLHKRSALRSNAAFDNLMKKLQVGDYFLLFLLSKNLDLLVFSSLMQELSVRINGEAIHPDVELSSRPNRAENFRLMTEPA